MPRREIFFAPTGQFTDEEVTITGEEFRHLAQALRHKAGDRVTVVNGAGLAAIESEIVEMGRGYARVRIFKRLRRMGEPFTQVTLAQSVPKGTRFDWVIEKGTELGVSVFIPLLCERSEVVPGAGKIARWRRLALAAMKQSCRSVWPAVNAPMLLAELLDKIRDYDVTLLAEEESSDPFRDGYAATPPARVLLLVGPEGGFSPTELQAAREAGCKLWSLGPRRLRSDTAGLVAVTKLLAAHGQLS